MKIGILLADELRERLQPRFGCYSDMFKRLLGGRGFDFEVFDVRNGGYPADANDCDGYLITGSRHGVYDPLPWLSPLADYIRRLERQKIPLVGVCFGHQAVAAALGGTVEKAAVGWGLGAQRWRMLADAEWLRPAQQELALLCMHQDQALTLPESARRLAGSDFCPNAAFAVDDHIFCVQGHPEFESPYMRELLEYRRGEVADDTLQEIAAGLDAPMDGGLCADWIECFFRLPRTQ